MEVLASIINLDASLWDHLAQSVHVISVMCIVQGAAAHTLAV